MTAMGTGREKQMAAGIKKNQVIEIEITDFTREGEGIGRFEGIPFFVKDAVIGDLVRAGVTKVKKNYGYARIIEILRSSPLRVEPRCPVARQCGGCRIQQLDYSAQLDFKKNQVVSCLKRIGGFNDAENLIEEVCGMQEPWHYRNKGQYPVGYDKEGNPVAGFYAGRTHSIIPNTDCPIQREENRRILEIILDHMDRYHIPAYDEKTGKGLLRHIFIRSGFGTGQIMTCLVINGRRGDVAGLPQLIQRLSDISGMTSIIINTNTRQGNRILGDVCETVWGTDDIEDCIGEIRYRIGPLSFYQVNPVQTRVLYEKVLDYASLTGKETVWDLYCGIGTISLFLAREAEYVYGVEIVPQAVENARCNAQINGIDNAVFYQGKAEEVVPREYERSGNRPDLIVVDPPRKGCDRVLLNTMLAAVPARIVYVSCDPGTLARDLKILCERDYRLEKVAVVDQFCHSIHTETVALLNRVEPK